MDYLPQRKQLRLKNFDYSQVGYYYVTICTHDRLNLFGKIMDGEMIINDYGQIVHNEWLKSDEIRKEIIIDNFVVMPNHLHAILVINNPTNVGPYGYTAGNERKTIDIMDKRTYCHTSLQSPSKNLGAMIRGFKSSVTLRINMIRNAPQMPVWQRGYYDHIIRNEQEYRKICEYIINNPAEWQEDEYFI